ncbi:MAG: hypothetical protein HOY71_41010, partial [Nonomuraea sp.]|nr:hypothetical protein [Nonomuraea sp.]
MSQRRSGLLAGLIVGFFAMLVGGTGVAAGVYYSDRLPDVVSTADGVPLLGALAVLAGLVVALAVRAVRPRGLLLPPLAALYAGLAFGTGTLVGAAPHAI